MTVRAKHNQLPNSIFFITFTCYQWKPLFSVTNSYDIIYKWFDLFPGNNISLLGYVIMPNHIHVLLHFKKMPMPLQVFIGNAKRFIAYEIIKKLKSNNQDSLLKELESSLTPRERKKGQIHRVFEYSFDAKECWTKEFIYQKLNYIHANPIKKKWALVDDFAEYKHSSAAFYEKGVSYYPGITHVMEFI